MMAWSDRPRWAIVLIQSGIYLTIDVAVMAFNPALYPAEAALVVGTRSI